MDTGGEERDGAVPRTSSSGGLDLESLLDRLTKLCSEKVSVQKDLAERDARIEELKAELSAERAKRASEDVTPFVAPAAAAPDRSPSLIEIEPLHQCMKAAEVTASASGVPCNRLNARAEGLSTRIADMFLSMHKPSCPIE